MFNGNRHRDENTSAEPILSPGVVEDTEFLLRVLFNPQHIKDGVVQEAAIPITDLQSKGFSVHRMKFVESEFVMNSINQTLSKPRSGISWKDEGVAKFKTKTVRQIKDHDGNQAFVVIDTAISENPGHASIYLSKSDVKKACARKLRSQLLELLTPRISVDEAYHPKGAL